MYKVKEQIHYWCDDTEQGRVTGKNICTAILDTGLAAHPDLRGRILAFQDCVGGRCGLYDNSGHGTHVGGILAGNGKLSNGRFAGMAPGAELVVVKVLDEKGEGSIEQILTGIAWLRRNRQRYGIRIVNLSVGANQELKEDKEEELIHAVEDLWDLGLVVVVSAGNYGPEAGSIAVPGNSRKVVTVGALAALDTKIGYSGIGPTRQCVIKPEVSAPGYQVTSCSHLYLRNKNSSYVRKSGASMATPVVSGAAALYLSKYPDVRNVQLKLKLRESCEHRDGEQGWGLLRMDRLLEAGRL